MPLSPAVKGKASVLNGESVIGLPYTEPPTREPCPVDAKRIAKEISGHCT